MALSAEAVYRLVGDTAWPLRPAPLGHPHAVRLLRHPLAAKHSSDSGSAVTPYVGSGWRAAASGKT